MRIVLVHPEIPQNTGSIARTCAALEAELHLIEPLGFQITEKAVRRAGLDYWPYVKLTIHPSWDDFIENVKPKRLFAFTKFAAQTYYQATFEASDSLVFGSETKGLGQTFLEQIPLNQRLKIPMPCEQVRSLNLSNAVSIGAYEMARQLWTR